MRAMVVDVGAVKIRGDVPWGFDRLDGEKFNNFRGVANSKVAYISYGFVDPPEYRVDVVGAPAADFPITLETLGVSGVGRCLATEEAVIEAFWEAARGVSKFVTFNGRCLGFPLVDFRSIVNGNKATRYLDFYRYKYTDHVDLLDLFCHRGASFRFSLESYAKSFDFPAFESLGVKDSLETLKGGDFSQAVALHGFVNVVCIMALYDAVLVSMEGTIPELT